MNKLTYEELYEKIKQHDLWQVTDGREGQRLDLSHRDLSGLGFELPERLQGIRLDHCNLQNAYLVEADLTDGFFNGSDFTGAKLIDADFYHASLIQAKLYNIDGKNARFAYADLRNTDFTQAYLLGASFSYANLQNATLAGANLRQVVFHDTDLRYAILRDAVLYDNYIAGVRVFGVDLRGVQGLETIRVEWIDVGEEETIRLDGDEARAWLAKMARRP